MSSAVVRVHAHGGPDALAVELEDVAAPGPGQARVRHSAIGVNFIDVYYRRGTYKPPAFPFTPGFEAAGVVEEVGDGVTDVRIGDRVAYVSGPLGAYAAVRCVDASKLVLLPHDVDARLAASAMLKGITAYYLLRQTVRVDRGDTILVHAAAGGVGLIACQWAKSLGATVIGTVSTDIKAKLASTHGCDHPIVYTRERFAERVRELTSGKGVRVVYDSVGKDTFMDSLDCLEPRGTMVSFGQSSGSVPPLDIAVLNAKGSLFVTRPSIGHYTATRAELVAAAAALFEVLRSGAVKVTVSASYPLESAAEAHRALESRRTTGSLVLVPSS